MRKKVKKITRDMHNESGMVIVEAAIVFPVMFFVLFFIIFIGNVFYEQAKIDRIVLTAATKGAKYAADPFLWDMDHEGTVLTEVKGMDIEPYRYILGGIFDGEIGKIEDKLSKEVKDQIGNKGLMFFGNTKTTILGTDNKNKITEFHTKVLYSTFVVQVNYEITLPIRFLGDSKPTIARLSSRAEVAVNDAPEFIRNVDMAVDLLEGTGARDKIKAIFDKVNGFIEMFANK